MPDFPTYEQQDHVVALPKNKPERRNPLTRNSAVTGFIAAIDCINNDTSVRAVKGSAVARLTVYELSVIPLFLLMGQFATQGGFSRRLFQAAAWAWPVFCRPGLLVQSVVRPWPPRPPSRMWITRR